MRLSLMPRKGIFFVLFSQHAENALEAAQALEKLVTDFTRLEDKVRDIHAIEHYGDKLNHEIVRHLNETFVTPLDREDIVGLGTKVDDITDVCYDVSELVHLFKVRSIRPAAVRQARSELRFKRSLRQTAERFARRHDVADAVGIHIRSTDNLAKYPVWQRESPGFSPYSSPRKPSSGKAPSRTLRKCVSASRSATETGLLSSFQMTWAANSLSDICSSPFR